MKEDEMKLYKLIGEIRKSKGMEELSLDNRLGLSAAQINEEKISNTALDDTTRNTRFVAFIRNITGGDYHRFGQITTQGYTVESIFENIVKCSPEGCNIFDPKYTHAGVAILSRLPKIKIATIHLAAKK